MSIALNELVDDGALDVDEHESRQQLAGRSANRRSDRVQSVS
jgi:hypothetical protein